MTKFSCYPQKSYTYYFGFTQEDADKILKIINKKRMLSEKDFTEEKIQRVYDKIWRLHGILNCNGKNDKKIFTSSICQIIQEEDKNYIKLWKKRHEYDASLKKNQNIQKKIIPDNQRKYLNKYSQEYINYVIQEIDQRNLLSDSKLTEEDIIDIKNEFDKTSFSHPDKAIKNIPETIKEDRKVEREYHMFYTLSIPLTDDFIEEYIDKIDHQRFYSSHKLTEEDRASLRTVFELRRNYSTQHHFYFDEHVELYHICNFIRNETSEENKLQIAEIIPHAKKEIRYYINHSGDPVIFFYIWYPSICLRGKTDPIRIEKDISYYTNRRDIYDCRNIFRSYDFLYKKGAYNDMDDFRDESSLNENYKHDIIWVALLNCVSKKLLHSYAYKNYHDIYKTEYTRIFPKDLKKLGIPQVSEQELIEAIEKKEPEHIQPHNKEYYYDFNSKHHYKNMSAFYPEGKVDKNY
jgi:hypothetical protein